MGGISYLNAARVLDVVDTLFIKAKYRLSRLAYNFHISTKWENCCYGMGP
jgi:hypothetical protein